MKEEIKKTEIKKLRQHGIILVIFFIVAIVSLAFHRWIGFYALIPFGVLSAIAMLLALKTETIKAENRIHTYKEILEFVGGTWLDELERQIQNGGGSMSQEKWRLCPVCQSKTRTLVPLGFGAIHQQAKARDVYTCALLDKNVMRLSFEQFKLI